MKFRNEAENRVSVDWDKNNLLRNYVFNISTQFISALISFLVIWSITRYAGTEVLAIVVAVTAGSQTILLFCNWTSIALLRLGTEEFIKTEKITYIYSARFILFIFNVLVLILLYPFWSSYLITILKLPSAATPYLLVQFIIISILAHFTAGFQAVKLLRMQGILLVVEKSISLIGIGLIYFFFTMNWENIIVAYLIASTVVVIASFFRLNKYYVFKAEKKYIRKVLLFSLPLLPYALTTFLTTNYLDAFFISNYLEKNDLGVYSVAYQFYGFWMQLPTILGGLMMPMFISYIVKNHEHVLEKFLKESMHIALLIWTFISSILSFILCIIIPQLFGIHHMQLNSILTIFILGTSFAFPNFIGFAPYTLAKKVVFFALPLAIVTAGFNFLGNYILIPKYGLVGSTYSSILSLLAGFSISYLFMSVYFKISVTRSLVSLLPASLGILLCFWTSSLLIIMTCVLSGVIILLFIYRQNLMSVLEFIKKISKVSNRT